MKLVWPPATKSGSSSFRGMNTVPPRLVVRSRPWSKNWPNRVNRELNGAESPTSGATFGIGSVPRRARCRAVGGGHRSRVGLGLVDDQVADDPRLRVDHGAALLGVGGGPAGCGSGAVRVTGLRVAEPGRALPREHRVRSTELLLPGKQVVAGAVDGPQTPGQLGTLLVAVGDLVRTGAEQGAARVLRRGAHGVRLGDLDLLQDEPEVGAVQVEPLPDRCRVGRPGGQGREQGRDDCDARRRRDGSGPAATLRGPGSE